MEGEELKEKQYLQLREILFIFNDICLPEHIDSFPLPQGVILRPATASEAEIYKKVSIETLGLSSYNLAPLQEKANAQQWWIIERSPDTTNFLALSWAAILLKPNIVLGGSLFFNKQEHAGSCLPEIDRLQQELLLKPEKYKIDDIGLFHSLHYYMSFFCSNHPIPDPLKQPLMLYYSALPLTFSSPLLTLSLFSVIESLLTHPPRETDTLRSITYQLRSKIALLEKRFQSPVNFQQYFGDTEPKNLWQKLYGLRSCVAHGNKYDFTTGKYQILGSLENTNHFLDETVREIIKLAIEEKDLIQDLKEC